MSWKLKDDCSKNFGEDLDFGVCKMVIFQWSQFKIDLIFDMLDGSHYLSTWKLPDQRSAGRGTTEDSKPCFWQPENQTIQSGQPTWNSSKVKLQLPVASHGHSEVN